MAGVLVLASKKKFASGNLLGLFTRNHGLKSHVARVVHFSLKAFQMAKELLFQLLRPFLLPITDNNNRARIKLSVMPTAAFNSLAAKATLTFEWPHGCRLTLALSGRPQALQARGRRKMAGAPDARLRRHVLGPLERIVRRHCVSFSTRG